MRFRLASLLLAAAPLVEIAWTIPLAEVVEFDVVGNGTPNPALKLTGIESAQGTPLLLSQVLDLLPNESYCASFDLAVRNETFERPGRHQFFVRLGALEVTSLTPVVLSGSTFRDHISFVARTDVGGPTELQIEVQHEVGPVEDPALYLDNLQVRALANERLLVQSDAETLWVSGSTVVGWQYDFSLQGLTMNDVVGSAIVEFVVWDDPEPMQRTPEIVEITINDHVLWSQDIAGTMEFPWRLPLRLWWLECKPGFDGFITWRLRTIPGSGWPAGSLFFGGATARLEVGDWDQSLVRNGFFEAGTAGWLCNGVACGLVQVEAVSWSGLKQLFR